MTVDSVARTWRERLRATLGRKVSQGQAAELVGRRLRQWSDYETGAADPPLTTLQAMAFVAIMAEARDKPELRAVVRGLAGEDLATAAEPDWDE